MMNLAKHAALRLNLRAEIEDQVRRVEHENIIRTYGVGEINGYRCIIMELVEAKTLQEELNVTRAAGHTFTAEKVTEILSYLLRGMSAAHKAHLYHRDLKLENVFILPAVPHLVIADFGMGKFMLGELLDSRLNSLTATGDVPGSLSYLPPEAILIQQIDKELQGAVNNDEREALYTGWDLYALGNMAYRLLAGKPPRQPAEGYPAYFNFCMGQINDTERDGLKIRPGTRGHLTFHELVARKITGKSNLAQFIPARPANIPDALWAIISKLIAYNPYERYSSCDEALQALEQYQGGPQSVVTPITPSIILSVYEGIITEVVDPNQRWELLKELADPMCTHRAFEMTTLEILQLAGQIETETATESDSDKRQLAYEAVANLRAYAVS
jgi:serine/threonine protein kinase